MEILEIEERILLKEDSQAIAGYEVKLKSEVLRAKQVLNTILKHHEFENPDSLPHDVDGFILDLLLKSNKQARAMHDITSLTVDKIKLPDNLVELRNALNQWQKIDKDLVRYLLRGDTYDTNDGLVEKEIYRFAETCRTYASTLDQLKRYKRCNVVLNATREAIKEAGFDFMKDGFGRNQFDSYFLTWRSFPFNDYIENHNYILNGGKQ